jgi:hypothetical protein
MHACESCGAKLDAFANKCPYCGAVTRYGAKQAQDHARFAAAAEMQANQHRAHEEARKNASSELELRTMASHSATWSGVGVVLCCIPVPSIVGITLGLRGKRVAKERGMVAPTSSTVGVALGIAGLVLAVCAWSFYIWDTRRIDAKRAALQAELKDIATEEKLSIDTACKLATLYFIDEKWADERVDTVNCDGGSVRQISDQAEVPGIVINTKKNATVTLCLHRGKKWVIDKAIASGSCEAATPGPSSSAKP